MIKVIKRDGREKGFEFDRIETAYQLFFKLFAVDNN